MKNREIKKHSHPAQMSSRQRSASDRRRVKNMKSPDVTKKKCAYIESERLHVFGKTLKELKHNIEVLRSQKGFLMEDVEYK